MPTIINPSDQTITQYNVQTGGASNLLNNVSPGSTSGIAIISQGAASQPIFGTVVTAGGGTGLTSPGSSGNVLTSNGTIWTSAPPAGGGSSTYFQAYVNSPITTSSGSGPITVLFNATTSNIGGAYNTGTGVFTAPVTGFYGFSGNISLIGLAAITKVNVGYSLTSSTNQLIYNNTFGAEAFSVTSELGVSIAFQIPMNSGDTLSIFTIGNGVGNYLVYGGALNSGFVSTFSGYQIA